MALIDQKSARNKQKMEADAMDDLEDYSTVDEEGYASTGNKRRKKKGKKETDAEKKQRYTHTCAYVGKMLFLASSILLVTVGAIRFMFIDSQSIHEVIMNFYFLFFGVVLALLQLNVRFIKRDFRFLNYHWGKALFCCFIAFSSTSNSQNQIMQYVNAALFFVLTFIFAALSVLDRSGDLDRSAQDEVEYANWLAKKEIEQDMAKLYVKKLAEKTQQAQQTYNHVKKASDFFTTLGGSGVEGANRYQPKEPNSFAYTPDQSASYLSATPDQSSTNFAYKSRARNY